MTEPENLSRSSLFLNFTISDKPKGAFLYVILKPSLPVGPWWNLLWFYTFKSHPYLPTFRPFLLSCPRWFYCRRLPTTRLFFVFPIIIITNNTGQKSWLRSFIQSLMETWKQIRNDGSLHFEPGGRQNCIVNKRFIGNRSKCRWCHYSLAITSRNQHQVHNDTLKQKAFCCQFKTLSRFGVVFIDGLKKTNSQSAFRSGWECCHLNLVPFLDAENQQAYTL